MKYKIAFTRLVFGQIEHIIQAIAPTFSKEDDGEHRIVIIWHLQTLRPIERSAAISVLHHSRLLWQFGTQSLFTKEKSMFLLLILKLLERLITIKASIFSQNSNGITTCVLWHILTTQSSEECHCHYLAFAQPAHFQQNIRVRTFTTCIVGQIRNSSFRFRYNIVYLLWYNDNKPFHLSGYHAITSLSQW